ncbi:MAG: flagellar biosynthesis protein FlhB [gamma proteobacterium symbiont of Bathyaustriella thionipta]|nr:flagellar biosynthesis protein FlhB [gamma proteobacterium symbiont of Bathyaustriella thionipta]MCU7950742.1 flagellar biosynthesis protein FlhB [gamma proteobacterium symbiont of Bathyaustriella thionipta]MCU7952437.1 flagellar biosynthesis protein FlhB [gamma proteobacterium symbiont of Bathyaustriella thionipta]MCU7957233.1 flagellar biosynthesis protein FlhB [gamma proteobacterium symbiont of Bathyaustriella thionipta]MCU7968763.1 flagellar biosynthesis protein FlhB [gamma proteobacteri
MMAENEDGQEKSEDPTAKKKSESRKKGQIPRSKELTTLFMLIAAIIGIMIFSKDMIEVITDIMRHNFSVERTTLFAPEQLFTHLKSELAAMLKALLPLFILMVITAVLSSAILGGFNFSGESLIPKLSKMSPIKGLKKMFGTQGIIELVKSIFKILLLGSVAVYFLWQAKNELYGLSDESFPGAFIHAMELISWQFLLVSLGMIVVAAIDVPYQIWSNTRQLKMTKQEVKDESKNTDGNPEIKGRQRQIQREMAMQRMMADVPKADVIITNPTHYAVALQYDTEGSGAPVMLAKGVDLVALQIRNVAKANDVPVMEIPPLSRAIYHSVEIGHEIPGGLYVAVAQVLAYIFQLKSGDVDESQQPDMSDLPIPKELRY